MSRTSTAPAPVTRPIARRLPSIYQGEMFLEEFTAGLDDVWAPLHAAIDCLHGYIDPSVSPPDFLEWLGGWVGMDLEEDWTLDRRRRIVAEAAHVFAKRGTTAGLRREIELYTDGTAQIDDPGSTITSSVPGSSFGTAEHERDRTVRVTVDVADAGAVNWAGLQDLIRQAVPAHLPVEVELREFDAPDPVHDDQQEGDPA